MTLLIIFTFVALACAAYLAHEFATAPMVDRDERVVSDEREAA